MPDTPYDPRLTTLHADMDAFYAAVEVLDDPSLAGQPLIIGHPGRRGVVSTASYEARQFGVHSALPSLEALRRCPQGVWRSPRPRRYAELSKQIRGIFLDYTPQVEPLSLDEAFLDVGGSLRLFGGAVAIAEEIRRRVREETGGLTVSVGVAENMFLAKLASDLEKPDGLTVVPAGDAPAFLVPLAVERLWGVGKQTAKRFHEIGLRKIGDLQRIGEKALVRMLGKSSGHHLWCLAHGRDARRVTPDHDARSISNEATFGEDLQRPEEIEAFLFEAAENVAETLRHAGLRGRTVKLKVRTGTFRTMTRSETLTAPTDLPEVIHQAALRLLRERVELRGEGVRLLGVGMQGLLDATLPAQADLFDDADSDPQRRTATLLDRVRAAHGRAAIHRARLLRSESESRDQRPHHDDPSRIRRGDL